MPLVLASGPSRLVLEGGTHNMLAPPFDFITKTFLPVINRMGPRVEARLMRHGFYPRGAGRIEIDITPAVLNPIDCVERGALISRSALAYFAALPFDVAEREIKTAKQVLDWPEHAFGVCELPEDRGPGNILLLEAAFEHVTEVVNGFGRLGVSAEHVARTAAGPNGRLPCVGCLRGALPCGPVAHAIRARRRRCIHDGQAEPSQPDGSGHHLAVY
jgi:RNA 3'-terminal phosphate cyclase (ATP)